MCVATGLAVMMGNRAASLTSDPKADRVVRGTSCPDPSSAPVAWEQQ